MGGAGGPHQVALGAHLEDDDDRDQAEGDPQPVVRDALRHDHRVVAEFVAEARQRARPHQRADDVQDDEGEKPHPGPAGDDVDDRAGDGQEVGDHHGGPGELAAPAVHAVHVLGPAVAPPGQQRDDALAPQPARPPVERVELHQPGDGGQQHHDQRAVPDPGERGGGDDPLGAPVQQHEQHRVGADQGGAERQHRVVEDAAERDAGPAQDVRQPRLAGPRHPGVVKRGPLLSPVGGYLNRFRHSLLVHQATLQPITGISIFGRTLRDDRPRDRRSLCRRGGQRRPPHRPGRPGQTPPWSSARAGRRPPTRSARRRPRFR